MTEKESNKRGFYITTTLPYVNADPHLGFATEIIRADILARYRRMLGDDVFFNTGTDEHGLKIYRKALEEKKDPQAYVDEYAAKFDSLRTALNLSYNNFIRTTDSHHIKAAQEFWKRCAANGDIEKRQYRTKYCVGCELEKTDSELEDNKCPIHPNLTIELIEEENYFFKFSNYGKPLLDLYKNRPDFVVPEFRLREIKKFVENGLEDFSISRLKSKMPWGVPVPGDDDHVMYVWFDALVNYISAIGWPDDMEKFQEYWPVVQFAGKDNLRQQSAMWQAMLLSAQIEPSKQIFIEGFLTSGGQKMSKSLGNVIDPFKVKEEYGTDAVRYYIAREIASFEDSDVTYEKIKNAYNGNLANGLGNLINRIMKLASQEGVKGELASNEEILQGIFGKALENINRFEFKKAIDVIWEEITRLDVYVNEKRPFETIKTNKEEARKDIVYLVSELWKIAIALSPFLPETSEAIQTTIKENKMPAALFPRKL